MLHIWNLNTNFVCMMGMGSPKSTRSLNSWFILNMKSRVSSCSLLIEKTMCKILASSSYIKSVSCFSARFSWCLFWCVWCLGCLIWCLWCRVSDLMSLIGHSPRPSLFKQPKTPGPPTNRRRRRMSITDKFLSFTGTLRFKNDSPRGSVCEPVQEVWYCNTLIYCNLL